MDASEFVSPRSISYAVLRSPHSTDVGSSAGAVARSLLRRPLEAGTLTSFSQRFDAALRNPDAADHELDNDRFQDTPLAAASSQTRQRQPIVLVCRQLAVDAVGAAERVAVHRLAREHTRRPCDVYRSAMLASVMALLETASTLVSGDEAPGTESDLLAKFEQEATAAAMTAAGGKPGSSVQDGARSEHRSVDGSEDGKDGNGRSLPQRLAGEGALAKALTVRVMRAVDLQLGPSVYEALRRGVKRRDGLLTERETQVKAVALAHRLAMRSLEDIVCTLAADAVMRCQQRARAVVLQLLEQSKEQLATERERAGWGLQLLRPLSFAVPAPSQLATTAHGDMSLPSAAGTGAHASERAAADERAAANLLVAECARSRLDDLMLHVNAYAEAYEEEYGTEPEPYDLPHSVRQMQLEARKLSRQLKQQGGRGVSAAGAQEEFASVAAACNLSDLSDGEEENTTSVGPAERATAGEHGDGSGEHAGQHRPSWTGERHRPRRGHPEERRGDAAGSVAETEQRSGHRRGGWGEGGTYAHTYARSDEGRVGSRLEMRMDGEDEQTRGAVPEARVEPRGGHRRTAHRDVVGGEVDRQAKAELRCSREKREEQVGEPRRSKSTEGRDGSEDLKGKRRGHSRERGRGRSSESGSEIDGERRCGHRCREHGARGDRRIEASVVPVGCGVFASASEDLAALALLATHCSLLTMHYLLLTTY